MVLSGGCAERIFLKKYIEIQLNVACCLHACLSAYLPYQPVCLYTGCNDTLAPLPQPKLKVAQYNQTYCRKVKSISAMDFQYFCFVSIFASFFILSNINAKIHKNRYKNIENPSQKLTLLSGNQFIICLIILCDFQFGLWRGWLRYRYTLYMNEVQPSLQFEM